MKKRITHWISPWVIPLGLGLIFAMGCENNEDAHTFLPPDDNPIPDSIILFNPDLTYGTVTDIDSNVYKTIEIGTQTWMAENLKVTKYNDGTPIPLVTDVLTWYNFTTEPAYCWYFFNESKYKKVYGALYNWYAVNTGKLCPTGWHVPTDVEWVTLIDYLGVETNVQSKLRETGITHWKDDGYHKYIAATNESGFTSLPSGNLDYHGYNADLHFFSVGYTAYYWSSSDYNSSRADMLRLPDVRETNNVRWGNYDKILGFSVRCIKD